MACGFIREEQHPDWVANVVPVTKKNGKIRLCVDFRDLNVACPKDDFPLPITDVMIDNTCGFERMSFMDEFSGYNQIKMYPEDEKHTSFRTPKGIYCYTVMPFGLKNAGATYQRAMSTIFRQHLRKTVECYIDDIAVKSRRTGDHLRDLETVFKLMRKHQLKMNPTKSFLGVSIGKFLGFIVTAEGIQIDPDKTKAILELEPPKNLRELRGLQGRLAYIRRFIANLSGRCQPFTKLMKKGVSFV
ncbi:reverse transcriptase family protein [Staphylococcus aureus]